MYGAGARVVHDDANRPAPRKCGRAPGSDGDSVPLVRSYISGRYRFGRQGRFCIKTGYEAHLGMHSE